METEFKIIPPFAPMRLISKGVGIHYVVALAVREIAESSAWQVEYITTSGFRCSAEKLQVMQNGIWIDYR